MRRIIAILLILLALRTAGAPSPDKLEQRLKKQKKLLLAITYKLPDRFNARGIVFTPATLKTHELYLKHRDRKKFIFISAAGRVQGPNAKKAGRLSKRGELLFTRAGNALFIDERAIPLELGQWQIFWAARKALNPPVTKVDYPKREMKDGFMRDELLADSLWQISAGAWRLRQRGGGMAISETEIANYNFQRAVNPFSVIGSDYGVFSYGGDAWLNCYAEARFYFGVPRRNNVSDHNALPAGTDMLMVQGDPAKLQVAFGWWGAERRFALKSRQPGGLWQTAAVWQGKRPPLTNWVKIGLAVRAGCLAEGWLDGKKLLSITLPRRVAGPLHVHSGKAEMEFDDVRAWTLPRRPGKGAPIFLQSRQFAGKKRKGGADPEQFLQWARSTDTFVKRIESIGDDWKQAVIITKMPLMGDFLYESVPFHKDAGELPPGIYEFRVLRKDPEYPLDLARLKDVRRLEFLRDERGWTCTEFESMDAEHPQFTLRFRRRAVDGNRISVEVNGRYLPLTEPIAGPVHFAVARLLPAGGKTEYPRPEHHSLYSEHIINEFFEEAPTDWNWIEGAFRMDSRWACQNQWNFMACGGVGTPMLVSKRKFAGNQEHEYFMSLRPVFPWDAGDESFEYSSHADPGYKIFIANNGWYNRHDLNFSFCFDGKNPLSGYAVVFGGDDNRETRLLRRGKVVARSNLASDLFPAQKSHGVVHWRWWNFHVQKYGKQIRVLFNGKVLFDYTDIEPVDGGHIAFWTVRNGFTVSRLISVAAQITHEPQVLYVSDNAASPWQPLVRDSVTLTRQKGKLHTLVTANVGAGFLAVRCRLPKPVDLAQRPVLKLPIKIKPGALLNIHLQIGTNSYLLQATGPLAVTKSLLTPEFERGEQFQRSVWPLESIKAERLLGKVKADGLVQVNLLELLRNLGVDDPELRIAEITVGNTSNAGYLLAGHGGNQAGAGFLLGTPEFRKK